MAFLYLGKRQSKDLMIFFKSLWIKWRKRDEFQVGIEK